jgi:hypothetical protein
MFNQVFVLDLKGKVLVARNYRGELDSNVIDKFMPLLMERGKKILKSSRMTHNIKNYLIKIFRGGRQP